MQMDSLLKEKDQFINKLKNIVDPLERDKEELNKQIAEVEIKNNDLTVKMSRR